jgi:hypothetical protein
MTSAKTDRLSGLSGSAAIKVPCLVATSGNIVLNGYPIVDTSLGVAVSDGDRVLVRLQNNPAENGIYIVSASDWVRSDDFNGAKDVVFGTYVRVNQGVHRGLWFVNTTDPIVIGTSNINFEKVIDTVDFAIDDSDDIVQGSINLFMTSQEKTKLQEINIQNPVTIFGSNLLAWLDFKDKSTIIHKSNNILRWKDKSGNDNDFFAGTTPPTLESNGVTFTATQSLRCNKAIFRPYCFVIFKPTTTINDATSSQTILNWEDLTNSVRFGSVTGAYAGEVITCVGNASNRFSIDNRRVTEINNTQFHMLGVFHHVNTPTNIDIRALHYDGSQNISNATDGTSTSNNALSNAVIGANSGGFVGEILEIMFFNSTPIVEQMSLLNEYVSDNYGIELITIGDSGQSNIERRYMSAGLDALAVRRKNMLDFQDTATFVNFYDLAEGGSFASRVNANVIGSSEYWVNDIDANNLQDGNELNAFITKWNATITKPKILEWFQGESDGNRMMFQTGAIINQTQITNVYRYLFQRLNQITGCDILIHDLARRGFDDNPTQGLGYQMIRRAYAAIIADTVYVKRGATHYDLLVNNTVDDKVHLQNSQYAISATRSILAYRRYLGYIINGLGAIMTSVSRSGANLDCSFNFDGGSVFQGRLLANNPITTTSGSGIITINHVGHGMLAGNEVRITSATSVGGITNIQINNITFTVTSVVDADNFTITTAGTASSSTSGGGAAVRSLKQSGLEPKNITLGIGLVATTNGSNVVTITSTAHLLVAGDAIRLSGLPDIGGILAASLNINTTVTSVIDANTFTITVASPASSDATNASAGAFARGKDGFFRVIRVSDNVEFVPSDIRIRVSASQIRLTLPTSPASACNVIAGNADMQYVVHQDNFFYGNGENNLPLRTSEITSN